MVAPVMKDYGYTFHLCQLIDVCLLMRCVVAMVARRCAHPGHVPNSRRLDPTLFYFPHNVTYRCFDGYQLIGNAHRACLDNGQWSGRLPICRR